MIHQMIFIIALHHSDLLGMVDNKDDDRQMKSVFSSALLVSHKKLHFPVQLTDG